MYEWIRMYRFHDIHRDRLQFQVRNKNCFKNNIKLNQWLRKEEGLRQKTKTIGYCYRNFESAKKKHHQ